MTPTIAALPRHATHPCGLKLQEISLVLDKKNHWRLNPDATHWERHSIRTLLKAICRERKLHAHAQLFNFINRLLRRSQRGAIGFYLTISSPPKVVAAIRSSIITIHRHSRRPPPWFKRVCSPKFRLLPWQRGAKIGEREPQLCSWWQTCAHPRARTRI